MKITRTRTGRRHTHKVINEGPGLAGWSCFDDVDTFSVSHYDQSAGESHHVYLSRQEMQMLMDMYERHPKRT